MSITRLFHVRRSVWVTTATAVGLSVAVGVSIAAAKPPSAPPVEQVLAQEAAAQAGQLLPGRTPGAGRVVEPTRDGIILVHQVLPAGHVQATQGQVVIAPYRAALDSKGTNLVAVSELGSFDVPEAALRAYKNAAATMARTQPGCQIPWTLLAGIGRVESDHGRYGGSVLGADGVSRPAIRGIALDGHGVAAIPDTDNGRYDGDKVWDRAVGPMQFIPSTWASAGRDGDGDGVADPNDIDDAALAAADYLCPDSGSILGASAMSNAILRYNHSDYYVALVTAFEKGYRTGSFTIPSPPAPPAPSPGHRHHQHHGGAGQQGSGAGSEKGDKPGKGGSLGAGSGGSGSGGKGGSGTGGSGGTGSGGKGGGGKGGGSSPTPTPTPTPTPSPSPSPSPTYVAKTGVLTACGDGWCLGKLTLDLGGSTKLAAPAAADFDGLNGVQTNADELAGLAGKSVTMTVQKKTTPALVVAINGTTY